MRLNIAVAGHTALILHGLCGHVSERAYMCRTLFLGRCSCSGCDFSPITLPPEAVDSHDYSPTRSHERSPTFSRSFPPFVSSKQVCQAARGREAVMAYREVRTMDIDQVMRRRLAFGRFTEPVEVPATPKIARCSPLQA